MSEQLIRQNRQFVEEVLAPYFKLAHHELLEGWEGKTDSPSFDLACILAQRHFQESLQEGTQIIFLEIPGLAHFREFESDWETFVGRIEEIFSKMQAEKNLLEGEREGGAEFDSMQQALAVSPRLMLEIYALGKRSYEQFERDRAVAIMGLLSLLNPMLFEPWLVQGMIHLEAHVYEMALFCLTMAAIVRFDHPGPHLLMARGYHALGDDALAHRCTQMGADFIGISNEPSWIKLLHEIQRELKGV